MATGVNLSPGKIAHGNIPLRSNQTLTNTQHEVFQSEATMETYLLANGYTAAMLVPMGYNDKAYACRVKMGLGAS